MASIIALKHESPAATAAGLAADQISCPLCHTPEPTISREALDAGGRWRCRRCGQSWDASRLITRAAYAVWALAYDNEQYSRHKALRER